MFATGLHVCFSIIRYIEEFIYLLLILNYECYNNFSVINLVFFKAIEIKDILWSRNVLKVGLGNCF